MAGIPKNLIGQKFGQLTVLEYKGNSKWLCKCDCGNEKIIDGSSLRRGRTVSCGCYYKKIVREANIKHGLYKTKIYKVFHAMKQRCYNINDKFYYNYGGRGIKICNEWLDDYMNFHNWAMNNGYKEGLTIDRIDVNGNYEPNNCRWVDRKIQARNRRNNYYITYKNETHCISEWEEILKVPRMTLYNRIVNSKWDIEKAFKPKDVL